MRQLPDYGDGRKLAEKAPNFWSVPSILPVLLDEHGNGDHNDDHNRYNDNFCQHKSVSLLSFNCAYDTDLLFVRCMNSICEILMCIFPASFPDGNSSGSDHLNHADLSAAGSAGAACSAPGRNLKLTILKQNSNKVQQTPAIKWYN